MGPENDGDAARGPRTRGRSRAGRRLGRAQRVAALAPACALLGAVPLSGMVWVADVVTNLVPHLAAACVVTLVLGIVRRRSAVIGLSALAIGVAAWLMAGERAERAPGAPDIRILHANLRANNDRIDEAERFVLGDGHDIVTLVELPRPLSRQVRSGGASDRFAYMASSGPNRSYSQWIVVLSVWPLEPWGEPGADDRTGTLCVVARTPGGPIGLIAMHASSPWAPARWRVGNLAARRAARVASEMRASGLPVVVLGDLNATPTGARSRRLAKDGGLRRCKPLAAAMGTFPAWLPWPLRVAIDDALVTDGFGVTSWRTLECPGSDHAAVEIGLRITN